MKRLFQTSKPANEEENLATVDSYLRREFLNPAEVLHETSYVLCHVESSHDGKWSHGANEIFLADAQRSIRLEFFLGGPKSREAALKKIDLLLSVFREFREALVIEAASIERAEQAGAQ